MGKNFKNIAARIRSKSTVVDKAAANAINRTATFTVKESVDMIKDEVNLPETYIKKHIKTVGRASPVNLKATIQATARGTMLTRYPYLQNKKGVRVSVNKGSGFRQIKGAFRVTNLRGGNQGIAMRNIDAAKYLKESGPKTPKARRKLQRVIAAARTKPRGIHVLYSRSVNQLFASVREDVQPFTKHFMREEFNNQFARLNR